MLIVFWLHFAASIGGLLGLGFGFSVISAIEVIYFFCIRWLFNDKQATVASSLKPQEKKSQSPPATISIPLPPQKATDKIDVLFLPRSTALTSLAGKWIWFTENVNRDNLCFRRQSLHQSSYVHHMKENLLPSLIAITTLRINLQHHRSNVTELRLICLPRSVLPDESHQLVGYWSLSQSNWSTSLFANSFQHLHPQ